MLYRIGDAFFSLSWVFRALIVLAVMLPFPVLEYKRRHLSASGAVAAFFTGVVIFWCAGPFGFLLLLFFYASAYVIHRYAKNHTVGNLGRKGTASGFMNADESDPGTVKEKKGNTRDMMQVLANAMMAILSALYYYNTGSRAALIVFGSSLAEAASDTWAGEIGRMSIRPPFSIKTFRPVPRGMSGGVTLLGFAGGFAGSISTALLWVLFFRTEFPVLSFWIISLSGFAGCVIDSYLGATFQAIYHDVEANALTEEDTDSAGNKRPLVRGLAWLDNDIVNLLSGIFSALFAFLLCRSL